MTRLDKDFFPPPWQGSRRAFLQAAGVSAAALLAGCGRPGMPGKRITLTQWYHQYGETGTQQAVQRYADEYMKLHPDIGIEVVWVPGDYGTKLATALLTPGGPDIFESSSLTVAMVGAGQVAPLDDLFPPDVRRDFPARDLAMNTVGGKVYGVKMLDDTGILYYRPSVLQAAGLALPKTMDELLQTAKTLTIGQPQGPVYRQRRRHIRAHQHRCPGRREAISWWTTRSSSTPRAPPPPMKSCAN